MFVVIHLPTIRKIPDDLWDEIKVLLLPEKSDKTIERPVIPFRKVVKLQTEVKVEQSVMYLRIKRVFHYLLASRVQIHMT
jgi:hypothetical protein